MVECSYGGIIVATEYPTRDLSILSSRTRPRQLPTHSQRCAECKAKVRQLLEHIYGACFPNHRFLWSAQLSAYHGAPIFNALQKVLHSLGDFRGHSDFVKTESLPPCDFFVPKPGFIVEFDESQHFTVPRKIALSLYPPDYHVGFSIDRWISLCDEHNTKDNDPPYRDEQRAWYDTLRDLIPSMHGLKPTIRLYAAEMEWCSLDPKNAEDVKTFQGLLEEHTFIEQEASAATRVKTVSRYPEGRRYQHLSAAVATVLTEAWGRSPMETGTV